MKKPAPRQSAAPVVDVEQELAKGRRLHDERSWRAAFTSLALVDASAPLEREDLERLATAAYLIGKDDHYLAALERAHQAHLDADDPPRAARCAFWLGLHAALQGEVGRASGWIARAQRMIDSLGQDCVEHGYLLVPLAEQQLAAGICADAFATAAAAAETGDRFRDTDLVAIARHLQGRARIDEGAVENGLLLLDEAMVAVTSGKLSPIVTGLIYCSVLDGCLRVYELARAREWTAALAQWCADQPEMVAFTGQCQLHHAEIMQLRGAWSDAVEEAQRVRTRLTRGNERHAAAAVYQQAEVHRLRGEFGPAEEGYREASGLGWEPQPGLALLRLAQGRADTAAASIRSAVSAAAHVLERAKLLPAFIEISLAVSDIEEGRSACGELEGIAASHGTPMLRAMASHARGAVELAAGDAKAAVSHLREALRLWQDLEARYEAARVHTLLGTAFQALGDADGAELQFNAASAALEQLGAAPDLQRVASIRGKPASAPTHGLTDRELQVLRLVASGKTNKAIGADLFVSAKTIDRHLSNIFVKLNVPSRAAATAFAIKHRLI